MDKPGRETQELEKITKEGPLDRIKCLSEIYLDDASRGDTFSPILPKQLLHEIYIICHVTPSKVRILRRADNIIKNMSQPPSKNLGNHFVGDVTARNGSVVCYRVCMC
jgi:hypothetical protein